MVVVGGLGEKGKEGETVYETVCNGDQTTREIDEFQVYVSRWISHNFAGDEKRRVSPPRNLSCLSRLKNRSRYIRGEEGGQKGRAEGRVNRYR